MNLHDQRPLEKDLHAYADDRLTETEAARISNWLDGHAKDAARVRAWQQQNEWLHMGYDPLLETPVPDRWQSMLSKRRSIWRPLAVAASWLIVGGGIGFLIGTPGTPPSTPQGFPSLARNAALAHVVYSPEVRHPVEVEASQEEHLVKWLSKRLGQPLKIPSLQETGFDLVGGRLLPGETGPVAQFMYQNTTGRRLTLYVSTVTSASADHETSFRYALESELGVFYWIDKHFAYALVGDIPRESLLTSAEQVYRQLDR